MENELYAMKKTYRSHMSFFLFVLKVEISLLKVQSLRMSVFSNLFSVLFEEFSPNVFDKLLHRSISVLPMYRHLHLFVKLYIVPITIEIYSMVERMTDKLLRKQAIKSLN